MSSYICVMPVDWQRLWNQLVPAWLDLLAARIEPAAFRARWLPHGSEDPAPIEADEFLLLDAIHQSIAVDLPGQDRFAGDPQGVSRYHGGCKQVAGTKNLFPFVRAAYDWDWKPEQRLYSCVRRSGLGHARLFELLEALLLYRRTLPGDSIVAEAPSWPGHDGLSYAGYLAPAEVAELSLELKRWRTADTEGDLLFELFADRVSRSADAGCGLLSIQAGWW